MTTKCQFYICILVIKLSQINYFVEFLIYFKFFFNTFGTLFLVIKGKLYEEILPLSIRFFNKYYIYLYIVDKDNESRLLNFI